jgi:hypothetical protein
MATVRKFNRGVSPQAAPNVRRNASRSAIAEGAGKAAADAQKFEAVASAGNAVARLGIQAYTDIRDKERRNANAIALETASNKLDAWELARIHDPEKGALNLRGEQSFTLPEEVDREFNELAGQIEQQLGNDEQRLAFSRMRDEHRAHRPEARRRRDPGVRRAATQGHGRQHGEPCRGERAVAEGRRRAHGPGRRGDPDVREAVRDAG